MAGHAHDTEDLFYRGLLEACPDAVAVFDTSGRLLRVNRRGAEMLGFANADELTGRIAFDFFTPESAERARTELAAVVASGGPRVREFELRRRDGSTLAAEIAIDLIRHPEGAIVAVVAITRDITEHKQAAAALIESEQRYRAIFDHASDGILVADLATARIVECNAPMARMLGSTEAEVCQLTIADLHPAEERPLALKTFANHAGGEPRHASERPLQRRDGTIFFADIDATPVVIGGVPVVVGVFRDVTQRRRLEAQVRSAYQMEAIGRLAGGVAHDFNNILAIINCYTAFVRDEVGHNPTLAADLDTIRDAATRAERLTNQLLAYSRRQLQRLEVIDLNGVVAEVAKMLRRVIGEEIALDLEAQPDLWPIEADRGQLEQILLHLAINSRDAMPRGGRLVVATRNVAVDRDDSCHDPEILPGSYVGLVVSDTGVGMTAEVRDHLFEPFFTTKEHGHGTGLGLAMIYGVVKQSHGHIAIQNQPGHGTRIEILLPRYQPGPASEAEADLAGAGANLESGAVVLLVEDEEQVREAARRVLSRAGHTVLYARDGREALAICASHAGPIDLMLTDVVMPKMNGKELADRLARLRPEMRVLFMSGYPENVLSDRGVISTDLAFLPKPFLPDDLLAKVRDVLAR